MRNILVFLVLILISGPAFGQSLFNIQQSYIQHLDEDSYRLRIEVDWNDDVLLPPSSYYPPDFSVGPGHPRLRYFDLSTSLPNTYNYYHDFNEFLIHKSRQILFDGKVSFIGEQGA
ncbi:MAG: hypothetical protein ABIE07_14445 [Candidatus Zixiibacteriota bacterium]